MTWHKNRFTFDPNKFLLNCIICNREMYFPKSKFGKYKTCGKDCREKHSENIANQYKRNCATCLKEFFPRKNQLENGIGLYCSHKCSSHVRLMFTHTPEAIAKRVATLKKSIETGKYVPSKGENNKKWKGGEKASKERKKPLLAERIKKYRDKNPEKDKEWELRRKSRKWGRLPKGTIINLMKSQKNKCVVCEIDIAKKYHIDHIQPLAKGGLHTPFNIQLLCPTCNMRKSAKDPIDFMQENGKLL